MRLKDMKLVNVRDKKFNFLIVLGATEQHGPFIPFGTDTYIIDHLVERLELIDPDLVVLPTLEFSRSKEHAGFPGTVYLRADTLKLVLRDICFSLKDVANKILITTFHHNEPYVLEFIEESELKNIFLLEVFDNQDDKKIERLIDGPCDDHAGNTEICNLLAIDEKLVVRPKDDYRKVKIDEPFSEDDLSLKSKDGIADNHPEWKIDKEIGQKILDIYFERMVLNYKNIIGG